MCGEHNNPGFWVNVSSLLFGDRIPATAEQRHESQRGTTRAGRKGGREGAAFPCACDRLQQQRPECIPDGRRTTFQVWRKRHSNNSRLIVCTAQTEGGRPWTAPETNSGGISLVIPAREGCFLQLSVSVAGTTVGNKSTTIESSVYT